MASRKIEDLEFGLRSRVRAMVRDLEEEGITLLIYCTFRSPEEQARLYRQSRSRDEIDVKVRKLEDRGFKFFADILVGVGPQKGFLGRHVTFAGPGESFHQYRLAADGVPIIEGKCGWSKTIYKKQWEAYGKAARKHRFFWAGDWKGFQEFPHIQSMPSGNPLKILDHEMIFKVILGLGQSGLFDK